MSNDIINEIRKALNNMQGSINKLSRIAEDNKFGISGVTKIDDSLPSPWADKEDKGMYIHLQKRKDFLNIEELEKFRMNDTDDDTWVNCEGCGKRGTKAIMGYLGGEWLCFTCILNTHVNNVEEKSGSFKTTKDLSEAFPEMPVFQCMDAHAPHDVVTASITPSDVICASIISEKLNYDLGVALSLLRNDTDARMSKSFSGARKTADKIILDLESVGIHMTKVKNS